MNPLRINTVHTEISDILANKQKSLRTTFGKIEHKLPQQTDLRRRLQATNRPLLHLAMSTSSNKG